MHKNPEFVFVLVVAAVSMAALVYLVFTLAGGSPSVDSSGTPSGYAVSTTQSTGSGASWFWNPFLAGFILVVIAGAIIYHYWHHE